MPDVLFIPSWYPNRTAKDSGNFIKRLVEADAPFDNVSVLFVTPDAALREKYEVTATGGQRFLEVRVYYRQIPGNSLFSMPVKAFRRMKAYKLGLEEIRKRRNNPQIIHVQAALPAILYARRLARKLNIPYVVTEHGLGYHISKRNSFAEKILFLFMKAAYKHAAKIITVSNYLGDAIRKNGVKNNYLVIPNVVPLPDLPPSAVQSASKKRIIHISTLSEVKNVRGIINAVKQVSILRQDFELVIVSEPEEQKELKNYVNAAGLGAETVKFLPYIDDTAELLQLLYSGSFMVLFSNYETFSIVLAESLWAGRPVISSRCGGPQEFISEQFGLLVEPGDEKGLEQAIIRMLDTSQNYDCKKMREFARNHFAPAVVGKKMRELHEEVLNEN